MSRRMQVRASLLFRERPTPFFYLGSTVALLQWQHSSSSIAHAAGFSALPFLLQSRVHAQQLPQQLREHRQWGLCRPHVRLLRVA